jgi:hypothetical protein
MEIQNTKKIVNINKPAYIMFATAALLFLLFQNIEQSAIFMGMALIFDPFDITISFKERPLYQQIWLFIHFSIALILFVLMFFTH